MKFLIDAQLPRRLECLLSKTGHDVVHTQSLAAGNRTEDGEIIRLSLAEQRVVVSKDEDFIDSILLRQEPHQLLLVSTGNIRNAELLKLFEENLDKIVSALEISKFVELSRTSLIVHS